MPGKWTYRKYQGDDMYSYALFNPAGQVVMAGLSRSAAQYEANTRNPEQEVYHTRVGIRIGQAIYTLSDKPGVTNWMGKLFGYAIGERGAWNVYDGKNVSRSKDEVSALYGKKLGTVKTLAEAGKIAKSNYDNQQEN